MWIASFSLGGAIGPLVGGVLLEFFRWGSVFLRRGAGDGAAAACSGPALLPEYRDPHAGRLDLPSVALSLAAVLATIYGAQAASPSTASAWLPLALLLAGLAVGALFVRRQRAARLSAARPAAVPPAARSARRSRPTRCRCLAMFGVYIFITQYLQLVLGLSPLQAGSGDGAVGARASSSARW